MTTSRIATTYRASERGNIGYASLISVFFIVYTASHYILLIVNESYQPTLLDEIASVALAPFALYYVISKKEYFISLVYLVYIAALLLGAAIFEESGVPQPVSGIVAAALDLKLPIFIFAFACFFSPIPNPDRIFRVLFITFIVIGLINVPFVILNYITGADLFGGNLGQKGDFILPTGLMRHYVEVAWISCLASLSALAMFAQKRNVLFLALALFFALILLSTVSIKETAAYFVGVFIMLRGQNASKMITVFAFFAGIFFLAVIVSETSLGHAMLNHAGMFVGKDAIETVRWGMTEASLQIAGEYFPLGSGGGTFGSAPSYQNNYSYLYYLYGIYTLDGGGADNANFLQDVFWAKVLGEAGWFGFSAYVGFLLILVRRIMKSRALVDRDTDVILRFCLACAVLLGMISLASSPFTNQLLVFVAGICFGFGLSVAATPRKGVVAPRHI